MSEFTPTTDMVRGKYAMVLDETAGWTWSKEWGEDFDRWFRRECARERAEALRTQRDFFASIDMDVAADYCEQWAIAYGADRIEATT